MRTLITAVAVFAVVFGSLGALDWSVRQAQTPPAGEVSVTQLTDAADAEALANITPSYRLAKAL